MELTYQVYAEQAANEPIPKLDDTLFRGRPLFGCFYYAVRDTTIINPHFINNDRPGLRPLSHARQSVRRDELRRMFIHIREAIPTATIVSGHSWLYNLPAYTRLFPPRYTHDMVENPDGVLNQMVLWYQCFARFWEVKPAIADELSLSVMLAVSDAQAAKAWYQRALGAAILWDLGSVVGLEVLGSAFFLGEPASNGWETPTKLGMPSTRIQILCDDPDQVYARAVAAGANGSEGAGHPITQPLSIA